MENKITKKAPVCKSSSKVHLELVDITKPYNNHNAKMFSREEPGTDLADILFRFAKKNGTDPKNICLYIWDPEDWSIRCNDFIRATT